MPDYVMEAIGIDPETAKADPTFNGLRALGLTKPQVDVLNRMVCGTQTIEGAPFLKDEHLPVFDCANRCGTMGKRFIAPNGHIHMMAAAQPFISGAISKTINLPNEASIDEIGKSYMLSWQLGLKANALYRDGCKLSQPLSTSSESDEDDVETEDVSAVATPEPTYIERIVEKIIERPMRRRLPDTRESLTHKFNVAGHEGYLIVGLYEDGTPGELFITMAKEGSTIGGLMDSLGTAISVALQYGVPVQSLVNKFAHQRFEPMGITTNSDIPFAKSLVDYIFRWLGIQFIEGYREQNSPNRGEKKTGTELPRTSKTTNTVKEDAPRWKQDATSTTSKDSTLTNPGSAGTGKTGGVSSSTPDMPDMTTSTGADGDLDTSTPGGAATTQPSASVLDQLNANLMGDAPACDVCGSITVRNGTCYKCNNCGNSMGCS
jgi:ribonucleoside-diphosphate reductase alpha chain